MLKLLNEKSVISFPFPVNENTLLKIADFFGYEQDACILLSGGTEETSQRSFFFLFPYESTIINHSMGDPWENLKKNMGNTLQKPSSHLSGFPEWVGYFCYEMGAYADPDKIIPHALPDIPIAYFRRYTLTIAADHLLQTLTLITVNEAVSSLSEFCRVWIEELVSESYWKRFLQSREFIPFSKSNFKQTFMKSFFETYAEYQKKIEKIKNFIELGDIYQVTLSHSIGVEQKCDAFALFRKIFYDNPAAFSAFFKTKDWTIVSSSPERFLSHTAGNLETRPIKGTAPRGKTLAEDQSNQAQLFASEKEKAELLMITDLMRNDLARVSRSGSVEVDKMWQCEGYTNVFHLYSIIRSQSMSSLHPVDLIRKTFPGGSVTGCPKLRAMEIINEIENRPRGIYTGSIGYFSGNGDFNFNVAIRTLLVHQNRVEIQLGGGIVYDSMASQEYLETLYKGETILKALNIGVLN